MTDSERVKYLEDLIRQRVQMADWMLARSDDRHVRDTIELIIAPLREIK